MFICGLPLLGQIVRTAHGSWFSTTEAWAATLRLAAAMSGVSGRASSSETAFFSAERAILPAGFREAGILPRR